MRLPEKDDLSVECRRFFLENVDSAPVSTVWDAFKIHSRSTLIMHIAKLKSTSEVALAQAITNLSSAEKTFTKEPSTSRATNLKLQTRVVEQLHYKKAKRKLFFHKQKYEHGERAGKLLAYLVHSVDRPPVVISSLSPTGDPMTDPSQVSGKFWEPFETLYTPTVSDDMTLMQSFFDTMQIPQLWGTS